MIVNASCSLDGFVALPDDSVGRLFDWYAAGDVEVPTAGDLAPFRMTPESAAHWRGFTARLGALVVGRRLFDLTDGWRGRHPLGVPVVVVTHRPPVAWSPPGAEDFAFVDDVAEAVRVASGIAGERAVAVAAGDVGGQALAAGLVDEVAMDLVPVVLGAGRPFFGAARDVRLGDPTTVVPAARVTHLVLPVVR